MRILILIAVGFVTALLAQESPTTGTPTHFRWSESQSRELDYGRTVKSCLELSTAEKATITSTVLRQMRLEGDFEDMTEKQARNVANSTRIELVDLNADGEPEIIAQANGLGPCGGTGNCVFWIFQRTNGGLRPILNSSDRTRVIFEKISIRPWSTNGYKDIVLGSHSDAVSRNLAWFRFERGAYRIHACYYLTRRGENGQTRKAPAIWEEKCSQ